MRTKSPRIAAGDNDLDDDGTAAVAASPIRTLIGMRGRRPRMRVGCGSLGRNAGWIALHSGMAGGANGILIPERPFAADRVCQWVLRCVERDDAAIVVVAEGAVPQGGAELLATAEVDAFGHKHLGGVGIWLAEEIARRTGAEPRAAVLVHIQRGGTPTAYDRVLATWFGVHAIDAVHGGDRGVMVALRGTDIMQVKPAEATAAVKRCLFSATQRPRSSSVDSPAATRCTQCWYLSMLRKRTANAVNSVKEVSDDSAADAPALVGRVQIDACDVNLGRR